MYLVILAQRVYRGFELVRMANSAEVVCAKRLVGLA
jgi:hypothetical protein